MELNSVLFPAPRPSYSEDSFPGEMIWIPSARRVAIPCLFLSCPRGSSKLLLFFHGNAEDVGLCYELADHLRSTLKVHVLAVEYPGYGVYPGKSTATRVIEDAQTVYDYLRDCLHVSERNILVFGRSIGSGPSTWLAAHRSPGALLLLSAYTSIRAAVKNVAGKLLTHLVKERFCNLDLMPKVTCPTFLIHGQKDKLIPYHHSQRLHEACNGPCSLIFPANMDHNDFDYSDDLSVPFAAFLQQCEVSISPKSLRDAFLSIPPNLFATPGNPKNKNKGRMHSLIWKMS